MERLLPNKIEAALLYDDFKVMESSVLLRLMNEHLVSRGLVFTATKSSNPPYSLHFHGNGLTIEVNYVESPIVLGAFASTLASAHTLREFKEAPYAVEQHRKYVHLKITNGEVFPPDPFRDEKPIEPKQFSEEAFDFCVSMLKTMLMIHISTGHPLAVYWAQSDRLIGMQQFLKTAIDHKDLSLLVHLFHSEADGVSSVQTFGASSIIGREVVMEDPVLPFEEMSAQVMHFVSIVKNTGLHIPDGDSFGRNEAEVIKVMTETDNDNGRSISRLICELNDEFHINNVVEEKSDDVPEFDLEDPAERAMHERIEEMRKLAQREQTQDVLGQEDDLTRFEQELLDDSGWTGVRKKVDVASLRTLAGKMASDQHNQPNPEVAEHHKKAGRLGGLFSKK